MMLCGSAGSAGTSGAGGSIGATTGGGGLRVGRGGGGSAAITGSAGRATTGGVTSVTSGATAQPLNQTVPARVAIRASRHLRSASVVAAIIPQLIPRPPIERADHPRLGQCTACR